MYVPLGVPFTTVGTVVLPLPGPPVVPVLPPPPHETTNTISASIVITMIVSLETLSLKILRRDVDESSTIPNSGKINAYQAILRFIKGASEAELAVVLIVRFVVKLLLAVTDDGEKLHFAPAGRFVQLNEKFCPDPESFGLKFSAYEAVCPRATVAVCGDARNTPAGEGGMIAPMVPTPNTVCVGVPVLNLNI